MSRNLFNSVRLPKRKRNSFPLSFTNDFTTDFGNLTPTLCQDVLAGDIYLISNESFIRTQPLRAPAFTSCDVSYHWFFVPNRLVYEDWTDFIVRGRNGDTDYDKPYCTLLDLIGGVEETPVLNFITPNSLLDFLNFPTFNNPDTSAITTDLSTADMDTPYDMMPFNVYNLIYNEYYRDENLQPEVFLWIQSGRTNNYSDLLQYISEVTQDWSADTAFWVLPWFLRKRSWRKDYFTSALPFVQKGSPISLMGSVEPVSGNNFVQVHWRRTNVSSSDRSNWFLSIKNPTPGFAPLEYDLRADSITEIQDIPYSETSERSHRHQALTRNAEQSTDAYAFISLPEMQSNVMTISDLRVALALQQWFELNARTGSDRYFEYLLGHFGVRDRDSRLQRPEYLGGYTHAIQISEVEQTSATYSSANSITPQGNLAGKGLGYSSSRPIKYRVPEPGWIMCIQSIRPRTPYFQGFPRKYNRWDAFDYYDPLFDHLSEQAIKTSELFWNPSIAPNSDKDTDFGYTPRFSEYRTNLSEVHGDFRTDPNLAYDQSLSYWVSPRIFSSAPVLNSNFIQIDGYKQRLYDMFAFIGNEQHPAPHFVCHVVNHISSIRPMSKYATPLL